ncbi:MAG: peptidase, partial [Hyphomicrobiales bacterium]
QKVGSYRLFMGDAGALFLGFALAWFAIVMSQGPDAVIAPVTALWFGFEQLMPYLTLAAIGGGVLTFALLKLRSGPLPQVATGWSWARRLHSPKEGVPYGIALAFAALLVLPDSALWRAAMGL